MKKVLVLHFGSNVKRIVSCFETMNWCAQEYDLSQGIEKASEAYDAFLICIDSDYIEMCFGVIRYFRDNCESAVVVLDENYNSNLESKLLMLGIDMYLSRPVDFRNVCKYVAFSSTKYDLIDSRVIRYKDLVLDMGKRTVCRGEKCIELRNKEFDLLLYLLQNSGMVLSKTKILEAVWDMNALTNTTTVESHVSTLRRKLDKDFEDRLLHTVHCVGYKIE